MVCFPVAALILLGSSAAQSAYRPNIIVILADDLGWNDVSFHGSDEIPTPNIDALAYNGVILNQHYVQPLCTPSRAALLTGMYPIHLGMQGYPILGPEPRGLPLGTTLLPEYMQQLGYVTHGIGKWHLGYFRREYLPTRRGFDSFLGYYNGLVSYYDYILETESFPETGPLFGFDLRRNETPAWDLQGRYATDVFTEEAVEVIRRHDQRLPLFMYLAHLGVHAGNRGKWLEAPQEEIDKFRHIADPARRTYAAMVSKVDQSVGSVVSALQARGMLENSIIVFMSDNGAPTTATLYPNWGSNAPLRGEKDTVWEGGVRGAAVLWSPLLNRRPRVSFELMHISDWLPTLYTAAGGRPFDLPLGLDGVDQWASLANDLPSRRSEILHDIDEKARTAAIRQNNWKLVVGSAHEGKYDGYTGSSGSRTDPPFNFSAVVSSTAGRALAAHGARTGWLPAREYTMSGLRARATVRCGPTYGAAPCDPSATASKHCLYDVQSDPCERNNLADIYPTVARSLKRSLVRYRSGLVPQLRTAQEPVLADPKRFGGTWAPWHDGPDNGNALLTSFEPAAGAEGGATEEESAPQPPVKPTATKPARPARPTKTPATKPSTTEEDVPATETEAADKESAY